MANAMNIMIDITRNIEIGFAKLSVKPNPVLFTRKILEQQYRSLKLIVVGFH